MAKKDFIDIMKMNDLVQVKSTSSWDILKSNQYYYKILQEQNLAALNGDMQRNLEFMMREENHLDGINPVSDIYYIEESFLAYRTKIVSGNTLEELKSEWNLNLELWEPFLLELLSIIQRAPSKGYVFPDLFSKGNILYDKSNQKLTLIDNDGIQVENRWVSYFDFFSNRVHCIDNRFVRQKYFNDEQLCYTSDYNIFAFYTWFFLYFFQLDLLQILINRNLFQNYKQSLFHSLKEIGLPENMDLFGRITDLVNPNVSNSIQMNDFRVLCDQYQINSKRKLVLKS